jgi:hypothetical protein
VVLVVAGVNPSTIGKRRRQPNEARTAPNSCQCSYPIVVGKEVEVLEWDAGATIYARLLVMAVMTAILYMGIAMMPRQITMNPLYLLGSMLTPKRPTPYVMGAMMHTVNGIMFALAHTGIHRALQFEADLAVCVLLSASFTGRSLESAKA